MKSFAAILGGANSILIFKFNIVNSNEIKKKDQLTIFFDLQLLEMIGKDTR